MAWPRSTQFGYGRCAKTHASGPQKTHCVNGHAYTPANTYTWRPASGQIRRRCRACVQASSWYGKTAAKSARYRQRKAVA